MRPKNTVILMSLLAALAMLLVSCKPAATPPPEPPATEAPAPTEAPKATEAPVATEEMKEGFSLADFKLDPRIQAKLDAKEELVIRVSYHDVSNEFAPLLRGGVEKAAQDLGVDAQFVGPR